MPHKRAKAVGKLLIFDNKTTPWSIDRFGLKQAYTVVPACCPSIQNIAMARRLSKKKISVWLLLLAVFLFFRCGGPKAVTTSVKKVFTRSEKNTNAKLAANDLNIDPTLAHRLDSFVNATNHLGTLGVYIYDETASKEVYGYRADTLMRPASNMKMLTSIAAIRKLGPNYRFTSGAYMNGRKYGDVLTGDIGFKFTFDPWFDSVKLHDLTSSFAKEGIRRIDGRVIVDMVMREPMQHEEHWTVGDLKTRRLGMLYRGEKRVLNEVRYALRAHGVNFSDSQVVISKIPKGSRLLAKVSSPMYKSLELAINNSSNEQAECLSFALSGLHLSGQNFREAGTEYLRTFISKELGVNPDEVSVIHDGCGLCVHDRLTPRFLVRLLHYARRHEYIHNMLAMYMPVSGKTGTLHNRMHREAVRGKVKAKTGTLTREDGITSLAGYVVGKNGHTLSFAIIQNEVPVADARLWQDRFCEQLLQ